MTSPNRFRRVRAGVAALASATCIALSVAACSHEIAWSDYDSSCTTNSDCVAIQTGQASCCGFNNCGDNAAINKTDFEQYLSDYKAAAGSCEGQSCPKIFCSPAQTFCAIDHAGHGSCGIFTTPNPG